MKRSIAFCLSSLILFSACQLETEKPRSGSNSKGVVNQVSQGSQGRADSQGKSNSQAPASSQGVKVQVPENQILQGALRKIPEVFDPAFADDEGQEVLKNILEPLLHRGREAVEPGAAALPTVSADGLTYTFRLKQNAWSDGSPVVAEDYATAIRRLGDPRLGSPYGYLTEALVNGPAVRKGQKPVKELGVVAKDAKTLQVTFRLASLGSLDFFTSPALLPVKARLATKQAKKYAKNLKAIPANGAYQVSAWAGEILSLQANEHYGLTSGKVGEIQWTAMTEEDAAQAMGQGALDYFMSASRKWQKTLPEASLEVLPQASTSFLSLNLSNQFLANQNIRRALAAALDGSKISKDLFRGDYPKARGYLPPVTGLAPVKGIQINAQDSLAKGLKEIKKNKAAVRLTILMGSKSPRYEAFGQYLKAMLENALGIKVQYKLVGWSDFNQRLRTGNYQLALVDWTMGPEGLTEMLNLYQSQHPRLKTNWVNPKYDGLLARLYNTRTEKAKLPLAKLAEDQLLQAGVCLPLFHISQYTYRSKRLKDFHPEATGGFRQIKNWP